jgi:hypothetical protein
MNNYSITPKTKRKSIPILAMHRQVGAVKDGVFHKRVYGSRHFLRKPPAIALDLESLARAEAAGAHSVEIDDHETGLIYRATFEVIRAHGLSIDRGFGEQIALPFRWWNIGKRVDPNVKQLSLLGGGV